MRESHFHSAAKFFEQAVILDSEFVSSWIGLADAYRNIGELLQSKNCCERAIALDPSVRLYIKLADVQLAAEDPKGAIASLHHAQQFHMTSIEKMVVDRYKKIAEQRL